MSPLLKTIVNMRHLLLFAFTLATIICAGQNHCTREGLFVGKWTDKYELGDKKYKETGFYKIVKLGKYDTLEKLHETTYWVNYKNNRKILQFDARFGDKISVKDSIWVVKNVSGQLLEIQNWDHGILIWRKEFSKKRDMHTLKYNDYINDTSYNVTYQGKQLFKKDENNPIRHCNPTTVYYPNRNLIIPDSEIDYEGDFGTPSRQPITFDITSKKPTRILSMKSGSNTIRIIPSKTLPFTLQPEDKLSVTLDFTANSLNYTALDSITILTDESKIPYKIYCAIYLSHFNRDNMTTVKEIKLSKTKDKYLFISQIGRRGSIRIVSAKGKEKVYPLRGIAKINLKTLQTGQYELTVLGCEIGAILNLIITK